MMGIHLMKVLKHDENISFNMKSLYHFQNHTNDRSFFGCELFDKIVFAQDKEIKEINIDPNKLTTPVGTCNNSWPKKQTKINF